MLPKNYVLLYQYVCFFMQNKVMNNSKRNKVRIITALSLLTLTTVFATSLATFAWLSANSNVKGDMSGIKLYAENLTGTDMKSYSVTEINENRYTFINNVNYILPRFDPSNIDYTEYEKALVFRVFFLCKEARDYQIVATTNEGFHSDADIAGQDLDHLSNCVEFFIGQSTTVIDPDTFESGVVEVTTSESFVSISNNTISKTNEINIADVSATPGENVVYVVMQYNTPVIEYINNIRQNNPTPITYLNDINFEFREVE